jgi:drug/metabolite transporter (DMT)-like permease
MPIIFAFLGVVIIWSTTPLAIAWSGDEVGFLFGVTTRMVLGAVLALVLIKVLRIPFLLNKQALWAYFASGLGVYLALLGSYWGASLIPSGWISVIFGTSAVITGIMAHYLLHERLTPYRVIGLLLSISGLMAIFWQGHHLSTGAVLGVIVTLAGVFGQASTAVWIKKINAGLHGLAMTTGALLVSVPMFFITWLLFDGQLPENVPLKPALSILYLSVFGSIIGFSLYYYLIHATQASHVALITLITPVVALLLGAYLNAEKITDIVIIGTALILFGLAVYQWGRAWHTLLVSKRLLSNLRFNRSK